MYRVLLFLLLFPTFSFGANLTFVSDEISTSLISASADHTIQFTLVNQVPAGGSIIITPESSDFEIPASFGIEDIDFLIKEPAQNFIERDLSLTSSTTADMVTITTGFAGSIVLTPAITFSSGTTLKFLLGTHAIRGALGDTGITNPNSLGSFRVDIETRNTLGDRIDSANTLVFMIEQVGIGGLDTVDLIPPVISNGLPTGELQPGVTSVDISVNTNELSNCKYSTTSGVSYDSMTNTFNQTLVTLHSKNISGLSNGQTYTYFVRCVDNQNNKNTSDYTLTFSIKNTPPEGSFGGGDGSTGNGIPANGVVGGGGPSGVGGGGISGGQPFPSETAFVTIGGKAFPGGTVSILKEGKKIKEGTATNDGSFNIEVDQVAKGTVTFGVYATDRNRIQSTVVNTTISVIAGTKTLLPNIYLSPTVQITPANGNPGDTFVISGYTVPNGTVDLEIQVSGKKVLDNEIIRLSSVAGLDGNYRINFSSTNLIRGAYQVKARWNKAPNEKSDFSAPALFGIGEQVSAVKKGDLSGDGKINLTDFSILLFHWGTDGSRATKGIPDFNGDKRVNLTDFSILIFNWTG